MDLKFAPAPPTVRDGLFKFADAGLDLGSAMDRVRAQLDAGWQLSLSPPLEVMSTSLELLEASDEPLHPSRRWRSVVSLTSDERPGLIEGLGYVDLVDDDTHYTTPIVTVGPFADQLLDAVEHAHMVEVTGMTNARVRVLDIPALLFIGVLLDAGEDALMLIPATTDGAPRTLRYPIIGRERIQHALAQAARETAATQVHE
jgi:hypothetical protein